MLHVGHGRLRIFAVILNIIIIFELLVDLFCDIGNELGGFHIGCCSQLAQLALVLLGKALARIQTTGHQLVCAHAAVRLVRELAAVLDAVKDHHHDHQQSEVAQDWVDVADQGLEAHEGQDEADDAGAGINRVEALGVIAGQALAQRVEHADGGVKDHAVNDKGHQHAQDWVDAGNQAQYRHVLAVDGLCLEEEGEYQQCQQDEIKQATDEASDANCTVIQEVTANNDGHGYCRHHV